jgi:hypothetical protein
MAVGVCVFLIGTGAEVSGAGSYRFEDIAETCPHFAEERHAVAILNEAVDKDLLIAVNNRINLGLGERYTVGFHQIGNIPRFHPGWNGNSDNGPVFVDRCSRELVNAVYDDAANVRRGRAAIAYNKLNSVPFTGHQFAAFETDVGYRKKGALALHKGNEANEAGGGNNGSQARYNGAGDGPVFFIRPTPRPMWWGYGLLVFSVLLIFGFIWLITHSRSPCIALMAGLCLIGGQISLVFAWGLLADT